MIPSIEVIADSEMKSQSNKTDEFIDLQYYRKLVRLQIDMVCVHFAF